MAEDLSVFFGDDLISVDVTIGGSSYQAILDHSDEFAIENVLSSERALIMRTSQVSSLIKGATVTIASVDYKVRHTRRIDDGALTRVVIGTGA
jgi:hypothetical protein